MNNDENSEVKLIDFGLALKLSPKNIEEGIIVGKRPVGTASYMSPETIRQCQYSAKTDVWYVFSFLSSILVHVA